MRGWRGCGKFYLAVAVAMAVVGVGRGGLAADPSSLYRPRVIPPVPARQPTSFAVMAFENRSGVKSLDWMSAGVAFMVGEKTELNHALQPAYDELVVARGVRPVKANAQAVAAFARKHEAKWVWTGWFDRPDWDLQLAIQLWKLDGKRATRVGEVVRRGDFKDVHAFIGESVERLSDKGGKPFDSHARKKLLKAPTRDFYAFTLFGRGLDAFAGVTAPADLEKAEKSLKRASFIDPKLAEAWRVLGRYYTEIGKPAKARGKLDRALDVRHDYYPALRAQGDYYTRVRKPDRAASMYERAVVQRPWDLEPRYRLASAYWELSRVDDSFRELQRVVKVDADHVRAHRLLVMVYASKGKNAELVRELETVAKLDPRDVRTKMDLAAGYLSVGRSSDAANVYQRVLELEPQNVQALKFLGDLRKERGEIRQAVTLYKKAIKIKPSDPRMYFLLGALYVELGDDRAARIVYTRAQRFKAYQPEVWNNLGAIAYRAGQLDKSLWFLKKAVARKPNRARYRYNYALSLSASGSSSQALAEIDAALKLDPDRNELHYLRGVVLLRLGKVDQAEKEFRKVLAADPKHENARHNLEMLEQLARRAREGEVVIEGR